MTPATGAVVQEAEGATDLRSFIATLLDAWKLIAVAFGLAAIAGLYFAFSSPAVYTAMALVEVSAKSSGYVLDQEGVGGRSPYYGGTSQTIQNQMELIKSRSILTEALQQTDLDLSVQPTYFPAIGAAWAFRHQGSLASVPLGVRSWAKYAWGGEKIAVTQFEIPESKRGSVFRLIAGAPGHYDLYAGDAVVISHGTVGQSMQGKTADGADVVLNVGELQAHEGTQFIVRRLVLSKAAEALRDKLVVKERGTGNAFGGSGILELKVTAGDPVTAARATNAIATAYLKSNVRNLSEEANRKLEFLNQQLPRLQANVTGADEALLQQKVRSGNLQLSDASQSLLTDLVEIEKHISEVELERVELAQTYTPAHPLMLALEKKRQTLLADRDAINKRMGGMPSAELKLLQLTRDSQVSNQLYVLLLNKAQEIRLVQAGTVGNVRIVDDALQPEIPSGPDRLGILAKFVFGGFVLGAIMAFGKKQISITANTPDELEQKLGVPIFATIPHSAAQRAVSGTKQTGDAGSSALLANNDPTDPAIESIRSLRASSYFALADSKSNLVVISGPAPSVGKSFVAANLAAVSANAGQKVLLIDCDLRRGHLHEAFGLKRSPGLSEYLSDQAELKEAVHNITPTLGVMPTGRLPPNPAELLASQRFLTLMQATRTHFDLVIADSPPVMNLADAVLVGRHGGAVFVVVRGGKSSLGEVRDALKRFSSNNIKVDGLVFNDFKPQMSGYLRGGYGKYYYYQQKYQRYS